MPKASRPQLTIMQGRDYYLTPEGYYVFTAIYHMRRGYCCESGCRHCPFGFKKIPTKR